MNPSNAIAVGCTACGYTIREGVPGARCEACHSGVMVAESVLAAYRDDANLGAIIGGKYGIIDVLGLGGFGCVYEAIQEPVGRHVALKLVHKRHLSDDQLRQRFFREARVVAQLTEPTVVTLYDYGEEPERGLYMVFELVRGRTLHQIIKSGPQEAFWTAHIILQVLSALDEAHARGMVHRDIKPGNVMVVQDPHGRQRARLLDFGIAKVITRDDSDSSLETREGLVLGTPRYMSPEQARGRGDVDARSDLYSLAVLAYAVLSGTNPFERSSVIETIMAHVQMPPPPLDPALGVPAAFEAALMKALEKDPVDRFQTAAEMAETIHRAFETAEMSGDMLRSHQIGVSLGSAVSGLATPTPRPAMTPPPAVGQMETAAGLDAAAIEEVTQAGPPSTGAGQSSQSQPLARPLPSSRPVVFAAVSFVAFLIAVAAFAYQSWTTERTVVAEPLQMPPPMPMPASDDPISQAVVLVDEGQTERAVIVLQQAFTALSDPQAQAELYQRAARAPRLATVLRRSELRRFAPAAVNHRLEPEMGNGDARMPEAPSRNGQTQDGARKTRSETSASKPPAPQTSAPAETDTRPESGASEPVKGAGDSAKPAGKGKRPAVRPPGKMKPRVPLPPKKLKVPEF